MRDEPRAVGLTLMTALAASQAALVVLNPLLPDVARELGVSVASAGQLRTVSGFAAGVAALAVGLLATRFGLRELMLGAVATLACGSVVSALAPDLAVLIVAQAIAGLGIGVSYSAAVAATAEWSTAANRSRVLALTLLGPPLAWIIGMPSPVSGWTSSRTSASPVVTPTRSSSSSSGAKSRIASAARTARSGSSSCAVGAPNNAMRAHGPAAIGVGQSATEAA